MNTTTYEVQLINAFMGIKICSCGCGLYTVGHLNWMVSDDFKYETSWDAFMPVVVRARQSIKDAGWGTPTEKEAKSRLKVVTNEVANVNIENANFAMIKFIQWYNDQPDTRRKL